MIRSVLAMAAFGVFAQSPCAHGQCWCRSTMGGSGGSSHQQRAAMVPEAQLAALVQRISQEDEDSLRDRCRSQNPVERFAAAVAIGQRRLPLKEELSTLHADPHPAVRQAAGRSLLLIAQRSRPAPRK